MVSRIIQNVLLAWFLAVPRHCKLYMFRIWSAYPETSPWDLIYWWNTCKMFLSKFHHSVCFLWNLVWERKVLFWNVDGGEMVYQWMKRNKNQHFSLALNSIHKIVIWTLHPHRCDHHVSLNSANLEIWIYFTMHTLQTEASFWDSCQQ